MNFWQEPDFLLTELVSLFATALDAELGVTLLVGGAVVSGTLVGERAYLKAVQGLVKRLARELIDKPTPNELDALAEAFNVDRLIEDPLPDLSDDEVDRIGDALERGAHAEVETDLLGQAPLRYLHLRDPILVRPSAMLHFSDSELPIMRLRLTQVEGWIVGRASLMSSDSFEDSFPPGGMIH
jgi:hypothetical protein